MTKKIPISTGNIVTLLVTITALSIASHYNYLLFHSLVELFSVVVAFGIFMLAWNSREFLSNNYLLFLGIAYLFIGMFDLIHTLGYKGMGFMPEGGANLPTQLWISARYLESFTLLLAVPLGLDRKMDPIKTFLAFSFISAALLGAIYLNIFPVCFVEGVGLTPFKKISEYIICVILIAALYLLRQRRDRFEAGIYALLKASIWLTIGAELAFTFYLGVFDFSNLTGHFFKFISFYFIYKALVETGLKRPYQILFRDLNESEERLRMAQAAAGVGTFDWDITRQEAHCSDEYFRIIGIGPRKDGKITYDEWRSWVHPNEREAVEKELETALVKSEEISGEYRNLSGEGNIRWLSYRGRVHRDEAGRPVRVIGALLDITERKKYEENLLELTAELQRSNTDLEQFAYIASHDLQEPLRTVTSFIQLLNRRYQDKLDDRAHEFMEIIVQSSARMQRLLKDLLEYSRVGSRKKSFHAVELDSILKYALLNLNTAIDESGAEVTVQELPTVQADETEMVQLFQNLIGNGIKFRGDKVPVVEISSELNGDDWIIHIRDNGIGIEPQYFDQIFMIFNRLHQRDEYPGTGLGLALCKKIVERHGGSIWLESTPGEGTTFSFSLPAAEDAVSNSRKVKQ
jgi:PAS domain S-box-containing protein